MTAGSLCPLTVVGARAGVGASWMASAPSCPSSLPQLHPKRRKELSLEPPSLCP